jgi:hypothetical protein
MQDGAGGYAAQQTDYLEDGVSHRMRSNACGYRGFSNATSRRRACTFLPPDGSHLSTPAWKPVRRMLRRTLWCTTPLPALSCQALRLLIIIIIQGFGRLRGASDAEHILGCSVSKNFGHNIE